MFARKEPAPDENKERNYKIDMTLTKKESNNQWTLFIGLMLIALLIYCIIDISKDGTSWLNVIGLLASIAAIVTLVLQIIDRFNSKKQYNQEVYRELSDNYDKHYDVKAFINKNLDSDGNIKPTDQRNLDYPPDPVMIEDFMRFFKNVKFEIDNKNITWEFAKKKFSKYALPLHENPCLRPGIHNYDHSP